MPRDLFGRLKSSTNLPAERGEINAKHLIETG
jgi:hypothetical protein